ncbi:MAG: DUF5666 domain-containing protein [Tepidisphaerales bacterium]
MNRYVSRILVVTPAVLLLLIGVSSVAFAWGQSNAPAPAMPARPSPVARAANPSGGGVTGAAVVVGTVQNKTASTITVMTTARKTITIDVTSTTRFSARGGAGATLSSIAVGNVITAQGTYNSDGTLQATLVQLGQFSGGGFGRGRRGSFPTPAPSAGGVGL